MKKHYLISGFLLVTIISPFVTSSAQNAKEILEKSYATCRKIQNGHYTMTRHWKSVMGNDTLILSYTCYFRKLENDSVYPKAFHDIRFLNGQCLGEKLFTGQEIVSANPGDSTAEIASKGNFLSEEVQNYDHEGTFYEPLIKKTVYPFMDDSGHFEKGYTFTLLSEEQVSTISCYCIKVNKNTEIPEGQEGFRPSKKEYYYWIDTNTMIPIAYAEHFVWEKNKPPMDQYQKYTLDKYEINSSIDDSIFTLKSIPPFYKLKTFTPDPPTPLLPKDSVAPQWSLHSLKGEIINLSDYKGKVVLVDFFYESCAPCMLALPKLMSLYEKYKSKGLAVIGIDPVDKKENDLKSFLAKRGVTYDVLLGGKDIERDYHLSGYPAVYILDKNGKILFDLSGYGAGVEYFYEDIIVKAL
jgi:thiol-disulfide isomerase/thioredoxin